MIQIQTRIHLAETLHVDIEILEREDAKPHEREIAQAIERILLELHRTVIEGIGLELGVVRISKDVSPGEEE